MKKVNKKLSLNKQTIDNLNGVKGGVNAGTSSQCQPTNIGHTCDLDATCGIGCTIFTGISKLITCV